jgi:hypothetical protein
MTAFLVSLRISAALALATSTRGRYVDTINQEPLAEIHQRFRIALIVCCRISSGSGLPVQFLQNYSHPTETIGTKSLSRLLFDRPGAICAQQTWEHLHSGEM